MLRSVLLIMCMAIVGATFTNVRSQVIGRKIGLEEQKALEARRRLEESERRMAELELRKNSIGKMAAKDDGPPPMDKETMDKVRAFRTIKPAELANYAAFLAGEKTGMLRFFPDLDCVTANYVRIDGDCAGFVPNSFAFSFRAKGYTDYYYQDIAFKADTIESTGFFSQGMLVALGDVPIEKVDTTSPGVKYLAESQPDRDPTEAKLTATKLSFGVEMEGFRYGRTVKAAENTTYAVRVVAYRIGNGLNPLSPNTTSLEKRFLSLSYDTRDDLIVAFRIVKLDKTGPVTILWKELARKEAPKIKFPKGEPLQDIKP